MINKIMISRLRNFLECCDYVKSWVDEVLKIFVSDDWGSEFFERCICEWCLYIVKLLCFL